VVLSFSLAAKSLHFSLFMALRFVCDLYKELHVLLAVGASILDHAWAGSSVGRARDF
jgi:hypothetical protein